RPTQVSTPARKPLSSKRSGDNLELNSVKRSRLTTGEGLQSISNAVTEFSGVFCATVSRLAPQIEASPLRRRAAMDLADKKEDWLSEVRQEELGDLLSEDTRKADAYMTWASRGTPKRKSWVVRTLKLSEFELDFDMGV
ncbi:hypothetical protein K435DRAFT_706155, partial [Dendrothele bispora CBS 962.96]